MCWLALQRLFHFIARVLFLSIFYLSFIFLMDFATCLGIEVSFPANKLRNNYVIFRHFLVTNKHN